MGQHPLIERAQQRDVRQAKGFKDVAASLTGEQLAADFQQEVASAPRRSEAGKKHLVAYNSRLAGERRAGRDGEHVAIALVTHQQQGAGPLRMPEEGEFVPLHAGVALKSAQPDKSLGADDPNFGVDKIDLIGIGPEDRLTVVLTKFLPQDATRVGTGDTPLRALLEGLSQAAIAHANREALIAECQPKTEATFSDEPPALFLLGNPRYWELCRKREAQKGAAWIKELERLAAEIEEHANVPVHFLSLRLEGDPGWSYETGAPVLTADPRLRAAWEASAGRVKPKPRPKARKTAATPAEVIVEADLSRPVRPYALTEKYSAGDRIEHPTLGVGVVQGGVGPSKIRVLFDDKKSLLVHDRPVAGASA